jgi:hypothetical protein
MANRRSIRRARRANLRKRNDSEHAGTYQRPPRTENLMITNSEEQRRIMKLITLGMPYEEVMCCDELVESDWEEGYMCTRPVNHTGPHREEGGTLADLKGVDVKGREYKWAYEWVYEE